MSPSIPNQSINFSNLTNLLNTPEGSFATKAGVTGVALPRRGNTYPTEAAFMQAVTSPGNEMYWGVLTNWDGRLDHQDLVNLQGRSNDFGRGGSITTNDINSFVTEARPIQHDYNFFTNTSPESMTIELQMQREWFLNNHPIR